MLKFLRAYLSPALVLAILIFSPLLAMCQIDEPVWVSDIGGNNANTISSAVRVDNQNNIYVAGLFSGVADFDPTGGVFELSSTSGSVDAFVAKYTTDGNLIWAVKMGGSDLDQVNALTVDINGNPTISGQFNSSDFDADPGPGTSMFGTSGGYDAFIIKLNTNGGFMWSKKIGGDQTDYGGILSTDSQGNIITTVRFQSSVTVDGQQFSSQGTFNGLLIKYAPNGTVLWVVNLRDGNDCQPGYTAVDNQDNIIVCGVFKSTVNFNPLGTANTINGNGAAEFTAKYNPAGQLIWVKPIYGTVISNNGNLCVNSKGDIFLIGPFDSNLNFGTISLSPSGSQDLFMAKYTSAGDFVDVRKIGGNNGGGSIFNYGVWASQDDNIYLSGYFSGNIDFNASPTATDIVSYHGQRDFFLTKYDENLNYRWAFGGGNPGCINTMARNVVVDGNNDVVFTGGFCSTVNFSASACTPRNLTAKSFTRDMFLGKYVQSQAGVTAQITAFTVPQQSAPALIDQDNLTITITVPAGTNVTAMVPAITHSANVQLSPASGVTQNFTTPVIYKLQQSCSSLNYVVQVVFQNNPTNPQVCGSPGADGAANGSAMVNTYFAVPANTNLTAGSGSVVLSAVPGGNGTVAIKSGDMLLIMQMQDAQINAANSVLYGSGQASSGPDGAGGTGFTDLGNSGKYEYVTALNNVPVTGGTLNFTGSGSSGGTIYSYINADATAQRGRRTFQVIRVPQYANLTLNSNLTAPAFNGRTGGVLAINVAGGMMFNNHTIDVSGKGFRGGYSFEKNSNAVNTTLYAAAANNDFVSGKGEGIAGTPRYVWDGVTAIDNVNEGLPGGSGGRGAPANAGGGGNATNAGGGGGANIGSGGAGGASYEPFGAVTLSGGRPGTGITADVATLIMGGGGGGGHADDVVNGIKGGVGGGIVIINAGSIMGNGTIRANGTKGEDGVSGSFSDGSAGGGAGGSVFVNVTNPTAVANLIIEARGGLGGNTANDPGGSGRQPHGPGGGGGGGQIIYSPSVTVNANVSGGLSGRTNGGIGTAHFATNGAPGNTAAATNIPDYLQYNANGCYPELQTTMAVDQPGVTKVSGTTTTYTITINNVATNGTANGVIADVQLRPMITFASATVSYAGSAAGPATLTNQGTLARPLLGDFDVPAGGSVTITMVVNIDCGASGLYNASAQALYLDPTRTAANPNRTITAAANAFAGSNTTYETNITGNVPGSNYNGGLGTQTGEDITAQPPPANTNTITKTDAVQSFCVLLNPAIITGNTPAAGTVTYQWQIADNGGGFVDIPGAVSQDYDPPMITITTAYRRVVLSQPCNRQVISNVILYTAGANLPAPTVPAVVICANTTATFTVTSPQANLTYNWYADAARTNLLHTGTSYTTQPLTANTTFYAEATNGNCVSQTVTAVQAIIGTAPSAPLVNNISPACPGQPVTLSIASPQPGLTYNWYSVLNGGNSINTGSTYAVQPTEAIIYYVEAAGTSCVSQRTPVIVAVLPAPAAPQVQGADICAGTTATLTVTTGNGISVRWYDSQTATTELLTGNTFITPVLNTATTYYAETVFDNGGCTSVSRTPVSVNIIGQLPAPMVTVGQTTGNSIVFNWSSIAGATGYEISTNGGQTYTAVGNVFTYTVQSLSTNQTVTFMVRALSVTGCPAGSVGTSTAKTTTPKVDEIFVPNMFTPNGDGNNDILYVRGLGIKDVVFYVYDQWGELIFRSNALANGWDGTYKGKVMPVGVYVYYIDATMTDGKKQNKKGTITLLR